MSLVVGGRAAFSVSYLRSVVARPWSPAADLTPACRFPTGRKFQCSERHARGFQCARDRAVAAIDIAPELLDTVLVDPGRAIGEDHGKRLVELDMLLAPALQHLIEIGTGIPGLVGQQVLGQLMRSFHADAAMAEIANVAVEQMFARRVVQIDRMPRSEERR